MQRLRRVCALAALAAGLNSPGPGRAAEIALNADQMRALGVATSRAEPAAGASLAGLAAMVAIPNSQQQIVAAPLSGMVESLRVAVGQTVAKGSALARLQSAALADAQRDYLQTLTQLDLARVNLARDEELVTEGVIAESRVQATRAAFAQLQAALEQKRHALLLAGMPVAEIERLALSRTISSAITVTAPASGVVIDQLATVGQRLEAFAPIYRIARLDPLWLEIQVPVGRLGAVREGAAVSVPSAGASGRVITIARSVDIESQTVMVRALIDRGTRNLRPGQHVEASVSGPGGAQAQWSLPSGALARYEGKVLVFVRTAKGFRAEPVTTVSEAGGRSIVAGNLSADADIATSGVSALKAKLMGLGNE